MPSPAHWFYPYLLEGVVIDRRNQDWCADSTYIPVRRGVPYLVAILSGERRIALDWATRRDLAWRLWNTMKARFCVDALNEALAEFGKPEIFSSEQEGCACGAAEARAAEGSPFTGFDFTDVFEDADIRISMDGRDRGMDKARVLPTSPQSQ